MQNPLCRVVLIEPLIPDNTGNIGRTCVGTGSELHLVGPLGFEITESRVRRAGLDYWPKLDLKIHEDAKAWESLVTDWSRVFFIETTGSKSLYNAEFRRGDWIVFGKETSGIPKSYLEKFDAQVYHLPTTGDVRSLNLSNVVAVGVFELMRQCMST